MVSKASAQTVLVALSPLEDVTFHAGAPCNHQQAAKYNLQLAELLNRRWSVRYRKMYELRSSNRFYPVRAAEACGGVEVRLHSFFTSALGPWVVSFTPKNSVSPPFPLPPQCSLSLSGHCHTGTEGLG